MSVEFGEGFEPLPDIIVWDPASLAPAPDNDPIPCSAVRLIFEVSPDTLKDDLGEKREDYAAGGLAEYWVADANARVLHRHARPSGSAYAQAGQSAFGDAIAWLTRPELIVETSALKA